MASPRTDYLRKRFLVCEFDLAAWQKAHHRHPGEWVRSKLRAIRAFAQGQSVQEVAQAHTLQVATVRRYLHQYIHGGLQAVCAPQQRPRAARLTGEQQAVFRQTLLTSCPEDHGLVGRIWTGHTMRQYVLATWQVSYCGGIYDLLTRLGLSHQKAHADYGNADAVAQRACLEVLQETLATAGPTERIVAFDEFSVCEKPTAAYGWAAKNTRPRYVTNEKKGSASMGC